MTEETQQTLLYGQLHEGLQYALIKSSAVSGARSYKELCIVERNEEQRLSDLSKQQQYIWSSTVDGSQDRQLPKQYKSSSTRCDSHGLNKTRLGLPSQSMPPSHCYICNDTGHIAKDCSKSGRSESIGTGRTNQLKLQQGHR